MLKHLSVILTYLLLFAAFAVGGYFSLEFAKECGLEFYRNRYISFIIWSGLMFLSFLFAYINSVMDNDSYGLYWLWVFTSVLAIAISLYTWIVSYKFLEEGILLLPHKANIGIRMLIYMLPVTIGITVYQAFITHDLAFISYESLFFLGFIPIVLLIGLFISIYYVHECCSLKAYQWTYWISTGVLGVTLVSVVIGTENPIAELVRNYQKYKETPEYQERKKQRELEKLEEHAKSYEEDEVVRSFFNNFGYLKEILGQRITRDDLNVYISGNTLVVKATPEYKFDYTVGDVDQIDKYLMEYLESYASNAVKSVNSRHVTDYDISISSSYTYWV